jgi:hypothetical protein
MHSNKQKSNSYSHIFEHVPITGKLPKLSDVRKLTLSDVDRLAEYKTAEFKPEVYSISELEVTCSYAETFVQWSQSENLYLPQLFEF